MAAVSKAAVQKIVDKYRKAGLGDQEIAIKLLKRKDNVGKNLQTAVDRYQESGSQTPLEDVMGIFNLNPSRAAGSRVAGQSNPNASIGDKLSSYATSAAMGLADAGAGIIQVNKQFGDKANSVANAVLGTDLDTNAAGDYNKQYKQANLATDGARSLAGRSGGDWVRGGTEIAATLPIYAAGRGATLGARMADQGVRGAAVGAAQYADDTDDRLMNIGLGAAGGAIGQGIGEKVAGAVGKGVTKAVNARRGNLAPAYKEIDDLGKQFDVRTSVGDIKGGGVIRNTETHLERIPIVGMGKFREGQHSQAKAASRKITGKLKAVMTDTDYKALPTIRQQAAAGDRNAARVLNIVETAGDDTGRVLQASAEVRAFREGKIASRLYDKVDDAVAASGNDIITPTNTQSALIKTLDEQAASLSPDDVIIRELTGIQANLADAAKPKDFANMRQLRSRLGNLASELEISGKGAASKTMGDLRQAVNDDIAEFALNSGNTAIKKAYQRADKFYKSAMQRSDKAIANAMKNNKPDEIYKAFIKTGQGDRANNFYRALDPKGQAALRYQMADEAINKATNESTGSFSPVNFAKEFERLSDPYSNIFKGDDKKQMDGLVKLMRHVERAGQYKENPPTGVRLTDIAMVGGVMSNPVGTAKIAGMAALAKTLLTTNAGKNLLLAANKLPEHKQVALDNLLKMAAKLSAAAGAKTGQEANNSVAGKKVANNAPLTSF